MATILVVDDEVEIADLVEIYLQNDGFDVIKAYGGRDALTALETHPEIMVIILDIMMPKMDGSRVLSNIRKESAIPVMMLTAKSAEEDELAAFIEGADEYVTKPFSPKVLAARVNALLRRNQKEEASKLIAGDIIVDEDAHEVRVAGEDIRLSVKEFELLVYFIRNKGLALSREQILQAVWGYDFLGEARTIDTHVKMLRSKLGISGSYIKTIWGMGYKFEVDKA